MQKLLAWAQAKRLPWKLRLHAGRVLQWLETVTGLSLKSSRRMLVSYSYLFRDVGDYVERLSAHYGATREPLRILCAGCATGQEPYSVAILCDERGIPARVEGVDLSSQAVETARRGIYDLEQEKAASRDIDTPDAERLIEEHCRYFDPLPEDPARCRVRQAIRDRVSFHVMDVCNLPYRGEFDFVICRKMMYYLPARKRRVAVARIIAALKPGLGRDNVIFDGYTTRQRFFRNLWASV